VEEQKTEVLYTLDDKHFRQFCENTAREQREVGRRLPVFFLSRARLSLRKIRNCHSRAASFAGSYGRVPGELEWLLDNWYIAQREGKSGAEALRGAGRLRSVRRNGRSFRSFTILRRFFKGRAGCRHGAADRAVFGKRAAGEAADGAGALFVCPGSAPCPGGLDCALLRRFGRDDAQNKAGRGGQPLFRRTDDAARPGSRGLCQPEIEALAKRAQEIHEKQDRRMQSAFTSLRTLSTAHLTDALESVSRVEQTLREDPAGVYARMDDKSRSWYRQEVSRLARRRRIPELDVARRALELAAAAGTDAERHVGYYLFTRPLGQAAKKRTGALYVGFIVLITLFLTLLSGFLLEAPLLTLLLLLPVSDIVKNTADFLSVRFVRPRPVHRLELLDGVPPEGKTLCVITALLQDEEEGARLVALLEQYRLANRDAGENLLFGILADLPDSSRPMGAPERKRVAAAKAAVEELNGRYKGGYYLFFREPVFDRRDERYLGWERKRGARDGAGPPAPQPENRTIR
jgi:cyclic beta-1,2-glucan synthetase